MTNNTIFPFEILKNIFSYIDDPIKKSRDFQLVCKSWYLAIGIYQESISVEILDVRMNDFIRDMDRFPRLASKVYRITMLPSHMRNKELEKFRTMINYCHQLKELHFKCVTVYEYIKGLDSREAKLPMIEKITLNGIERAVPSLKRFHLWINFRFRDTIKHLEIFDLEHIGVLKDCDRLVHFTTSFPHLESIFVKFPNTNLERIDLENLLSKNKRLTNVQLNQINHIKIEQEELNNGICYPQVKKLHILSTTTTNTNLFQYVMNKFSNLERLSIIITETVIHNHLNATENQLLITKFKDYCNQIEKMNISFIYNGESIRLTKGFIQEENDLLDEVLDHHFMWEHDQLFFREEFDDDVFERDEYPSPPTFYDEYWDNHSMNPPSPIDDPDFYDSDHYQSDHYQSDLDNHDHFNHPVSDPDIDDLNETDITDQAFLALMAEEDQDFYEITNGYPSDDDHLEMLMHQADMDNYDSPSEIFGMDGYYTPSTPDVEDYMNAFPDSPTEQDYLDAMYDNEIADEIADAMEFHHGLDFFDDEQDFSDPPSEYLDDNWHQSFDEDIAQYEVHFESNL